MARKFAPRAACGLSVGGLYKVVKPFTCEATTFGEGEVLRFEGEGFIPEESADVWRFTLPETGRLRAIIGTPAFADPKTWRGNFAPAAAATGFPGAPAPAPRKSTKAA